MLKYSFFVDGVERTLVECNDNYAIYRVADGSFELHKLRWFDTRIAEVNNSLIVVDEGFQIARTSEFGKFGWHCMSLDRCYHKLVKLNLLDTVEGFL